MDQSNCVAFIPRLYLGWWKPQSINIRPYQYGVLVSIEQTRFWNKNSDIWNSIIIHDKYIFYDLNLWKLSNITWLHKSWIRSNINTNMGKTWKFCKKSGKHNIFYLMNKIRRNPANIEFATLDSRTNNLNNFKLFDKLYSWKEK